MKRYISIDGGTTNTRITLVENGKAIDTLKFPVGARAGISDKTLLPNTVKGGIRDILARNALKESDIEKILASGMITSESGLVALPHATLPAGLAELKKASFETILADITTIPFVFMRGVKADAEGFEDADMVRGEETEIMGLSDAGDGVYMLMGSHTKLMKLEGGKIVDSATTLTGELIAALATGTILKDSFSLNFEDFDEAALFRGFDYAKDFGINEALFKTRILKNLFAKNELEAYSFFLGASLSGEVKAAKKFQAKKILIGGKRQLKRAIFALLERAGFDVEMLSDAAVDESVIKGQIKIYECEA